MSSTPMDCDQQPESSGLVISQRMSHSDTSMSLISKTLDLTAAADSGNWTLLHDWLSSDDVTRCDIEQSYILHRLAAAPEVSLSLARDILTKILKHKVDINMVDTNGDTAVVVAARCDNTKMVMELLSRQAALPPDVTHVCSFLQTLTNNWKPQETPYMHALVVKLLWDRLQDTALHSCHKQLHHTLVRLAVTFHTSLVREMFVTEQQVNSVDSEGMAVLHRVAMFDSEDHVRVVLFLISKGANVNLQTTTGDTPLHVAAKHKNWAIMEVLLHRQAKSDVVDCEQRSVLHIMASYADPECFSDINDILPLLIHNNSDINKKDREGNTALHLAALAGNMGFVKTLLHHGARADVVNDEQKTVLHIMAMSGCTNLLSLTLNKGADVHRTDCYGDLAVHLAAKHNNWNFVEFLLKYFSDLSHPDSEGFNIFHRFAIHPSYRHLHLFYQLPQKVGDINSRSRIGDAAIHLAAKHQNWNIVKRLVQEGAIIDEPDSEGFLVCDRMAMGGNTQNFEFHFFMKYDLDCTSRSLTGETVLQIAAKHGDWSMVKRLVEYVGNIDQVDSEGLTLVQRLMTKKAKLHTSIFYRLLELGVNLTCRDANGDTVLHLAARNERWDIVNYLVEPDRDGLSAFHRAATSDTRGARKYVVNIDETDSEGLTLIQRLAMSKEGNFGTSLLRRLLELGADYTCRDANGDTVLHLAARNDHWKIVKYFVNPDSESSSDLHKAETVDTRGARKYVVNIDETDSEGLTLIQRLVNSKKGKLHFSLLRRLIELGADYTCRDANGDTVLHLAARNDHWKIVKYLVQLGVGTDSPDSDGFSVLHRAATAMEETAGGVLLYILKRNPDLHKRTRQGDTAVHLAARHRQWDAVKLLTKYGANILDNDSESTTVLQRMIACPDSTGQQICILRSLVKTCSVEQLSKSYGLLLFQACRLNVVRFLLDHGVSIHQRDSEGLSLLHHVAKTRECLSIKMTQHLQYFLEKGIGLEDRCPNGNTPLHFAAKFDNWDMVIYLVERGACIQDPDSDGVYVLQRLAMYSEYGEKHSELLRLLITNGADVTIRDCNDNSTLHLSAKGNNWSFVRQIIQETGDLNIDELDSDGYNILHRLAQSEHSELVEDVLNRGCNVEALSRDGDTCLLLAAKRDNWTFVKSVLGHVFNRKHSSDLLVYDLSSSENDSHGFTQHVYSMSQINLYTRDLRGYTVCHLALIRKRWDVLCQLAECGYNMDIIDNEGLDLLQRMASDNVSNPETRRNCDRLLESMKKNRFILTRTNGLGNTPFQTAAKNKNIPMVVRLYHLFHGGEDFSSTDSDGLSPLYRLVDILNETKSREEIESIMEDILISCKAPEKISCDGNSPLHLAAKCSDWSTVKMLLQHGARADVCDPEGFTVLHRFAQDKTVLMRYFGQGPISVTKGLFIKELLQRGASLHQKNLEGNTPLHLAVLCHNWDVATELVYLGAEVNELDSEGFTVLQRLAQVPDPSDSESCVKLTKLLFERGARCDIPSKRGETMIDIVVENENWIMMKCLLTHEMLAIREHDDKFLLHRLVFSDSGAQHTDVCDLLIEKGLSVNAEDCEGNTPLHVAARVGNWDLVEHFIRKGGSGRKPDGNGFSILHKFVTSVNMFHSVRDNKAMKEHLHTLDVIISSGVDVNATDPRGNTAIHIAAKRQLVGIVKRLIDIVDNLNTTDSDGFTVLLRLAQTPHPQCLPVLRRLVQKGADINFCSIQGESALTLAVKSNNWPVVQFLVSRGVQYSVQTLEQLHTIHRLIKTTSSTFPEDKKVKLMKLLTNSGLSINLLDQCGKTPAELAFIHKKWKLLRYLLKSKADINPTSTKLDSFFHELTKMGSVDDDVKDITRLLVMSGLDINQQNIFGDTPFHVAAEKANWDAVIVFVEHGADINILDRYGRSLLHTVVGHLSSRDNRQLNKQQLLTFLVEHGADINRRSQDNKTVLQVAAARNDWETVGVLIQLGADWELTPSKKKSAFRKLHLLSWENVDEEKVCRFVHYISNDVCDINASFLKEYKCDKKKSILQMCIEKSNWPMAKALVECGADVFQLYTHRTLLEFMMSAYSQSNTIAWMSFLDSLISKGLDINTKLRNGSGVLFHYETIKSIRTDDTFMSSLFNLLLGRGANPLLVNSRRWTLLREVAELDNYSMMTALMKLLPAGVTTHQPRFTEAMLQSQKVSTAQTASPTEKMIRDKNIFALKLLIESGASSNAELFRLNTEYQVKLAGQADTDAKVRELLEVLNMAASQPRSLQSLCRLTVSHCLGCGPGRHDRLNHLPIPPVIIEFLSFDDLVSQLKKKAMGDVGLIGQTDSIAGLFILYEGNLFNDILPEAFLPTIHKDDSSSSSIESTDSDDEHY
ncbi:uncharacterized protein LOC112559059 [Pomacea canaliculata]|uniref:uncharacterized protein LOC112559059 n=1 Tax=Pomacea canaliculata TaxID=400727 RepID=UPI000D7382A2|nr:uncharacterized protein LOC112559059 [Pomacea canaliculata]XP_025085725.1 uncharacterized protein LOC112559059 [Pomacea canaliculata]XP_025085726.1 uncharacterized protein LOC112559059 [Pomacea canaliculata]